ncbi:MAG: RNA polymerase sporulation sigma factor SigK [Clostridia bacterium]|nr:RNA polymerase sporulation sigma factor SigK [Clostridia bacterium]
MHISDLINLFKTKVKLLFKKRKSSQGDTLLFINGTPALPPPLTKEEEEQCFKEIIQGSEQARNKLIVHNLRLVVYIAKKFENSGASIEDLISIGTIGLIKAVKTFCPDKNIKLATYASRCIENEVLMYLRKIGNMKNEVSIDEPLNVDWDGNELLLSDILYTDENSVSIGVESDDEVRILMDCIEKLPERDRRIVYLRFGLNSNKEYTQKEVADMLGISQSYISRIEKRIIEQLKNDMNKANV